MRNGFLLALLSALVLFLSTQFAPAPLPAPGSRFCYLHGDATHALTWVNLDDFDPRSNEVTLGRARTAKVDALTLDPRSGVAYGVDSRIPQFVSYLGTFDLATGAFEPRPAPIGTGRGPRGDLFFHDVSGLAFDPTTNWLYAVQIKTGIGQPDALFRIDPESGRLVAGAFAGADYVSLPALPSYRHLWDVDDIAIDPANGQLYGIVNNSADGDRLVRIDKRTGALSDVGPFGVAEVEGLSFDAFGQLWATAGGVDGTPANKLYQVDKTTGAATQPRPLDNSGNYEALACLTAAPDLALSLQDRPAAAGGLRIYTLRFANLGSAPAHGVTLAQTLPPHAQFDAAASSPGWRPAPDRSGVYVLDLGALPPGRRGLVYLAVSLAPAAPAREVLTTAVIAADGRTGFDLNPNDNHAAAITRGDR